MVRGVRRVVIGEFPSQYRAQQVAIRLEWSEGWHSEIIDCRLVG